MQTPTRMRIRICEFETSVRSGWIPTSRHPNGDTASLTAFAAAGEAMTKGRRTRPLTSSGPKACFAVAVAAQMPMRRTPAARP